MIDFDVDKLKTKKIDDAINVNERHHSSDDELSDEMLNQQLKSEEKQIKTSELKNQHARDENWKSHFSKAFIVAFWVLWFLFIIMCISLIIHWILPLKCHWLSTDQLDKIKTIIIAALASKAISNKVEKT